VTKIFLRNDDVARETRTLEQFSGIFAERGVPVSHQVIPAQLTDECAGWVRETRARIPALVEFGQHGNTHQIKVGGRVRYYEFGPQLSLGEQRAIIKAGRETLDAKLGDAWTGRLFTPPQHRFDRNTLRALSECGFSVLSASRYTGLQHRLAYRIGRALGRTNIGRAGVSYHGGTRPEAPLKELSISVAVDDGPAGPPQGRGVDEIMARLAEARRQLRVVGLMFHHEAWRGDGGYDFLSRLADRLVALPDVEFGLITSLADGRSCEAAA